MGMGFSGGERAKRKTISINVINLPDNFTKGPGEVEKQRKWLFPSRQPPPSFLPDYRLLCCRLVIAFITAEKKKEKRKTKKKTDQK